MDIERTTGGMLLGQCERIAAGLERALEFYNGSLGEDEITVEDVTAGALESGDLHLCDDDECYRAEDGPHFHATGRELEEAALEYLDDFLSIEGVWKGSSKDNAELHHVEVVFGTGGPHVELDTDERAVMGWWGSDQVRIPVDSDVCAYYEEMMQ